VNYAQLEPEEKRSRLLELAVVFSKLGITAFGGPAAHIAMIDDEVVKRRQWMEREQLLDLLGITNLIPGPNSTELAIHIGLERAGWMGLLVAGTCFILPAMFIVWALAAIYVQYQTIPQVDWLLYGVKPVIIAIILQALWKLGKSAIKNGQTLGAGIVVIVLFALGVNEILLLLLTGLVIMLISRWQVTQNNRDDNSNASLFLPVSSLIASLSSSWTPSGWLIATAPMTLAVTAESPTWLAIFLFFLKIGAVLYGSGYVLLAFLQQELVDRLHWLTSQQLLDAVAIGQVTPGPVFTTATFVGYLLAGHAGAIAATIGIFLPAFVLVAVVRPWVTNLRRSPQVSGFLDGVNVASLGLMAVVTWQLGRTAIVDWLSALMAIASCIAVFRYKINSAWLVIAGGLIGILAQNIFTTLVTKP
jgi:chromate transporter